jgi:hypothetical protein
MVRVGTVSITQLPHVGDSTSDRRGQTFRVATVGDEQAAVVREPSWVPVMLFLMLNAAGFALTLLVFYPGVLTVDAMAVYADVKSGFVGDWQSPVMAKLWTVIDPMTRRILDLPPGLEGAVVSMFLLTISLYWLAFTILSLAVSRDSMAIAGLVVIIALSPPLFVMAGAIWRDILLAVTWLLAAALAYATVHAPRLPSIMARAAALVLIGFGLLLRPNALLAAPFVLAYVVWPAAFRLRRVALLYIPVVIAGFLMVQLVYYVILDAKRQHIMHAILVFDLGAITAITQENQFPVDWTEHQLQLLKASCYDPSQWDTYWRVPPCQFVMGGKLEPENVFGTPVLVQAWLKAVASHPLIYLRHRLGHIEAFLTFPHSAIYLQSIGKGVPMYPHNAYFMRLYQATDALKESFIFRPLTWLLVVLATLVAAWRYRMRPPGSYAVAMSASALAYVATFLVVGVASDYRYVYWVVAAGLTSAAMIVLAWTTGRSGAPRPRTSRLPSRRGEEIGAQGAERQPGTADRPLPGPGQKLGEPALRHQDQVPFQSPVVLAQGSTGDAKRLVPPVQKGDGGVMLDREVPVGDRDEDRFADPA